MNSNMQQWLLIRIVQDASCLWWRDCNCECGRKHQAPSIETAYCMTMYFMLLKAILARHVRNQNADSHMLPDARHVKSIHLFAKPCIIICNVLQLRIWSYPPAPANLMLLCALCSSTCFEKLCIWEQDHVALAADPAPKKRLRNYKVILTSSTKDSTKSRKPGKIPRMCVCVYVI